jgi:transcriptional regulator with XRE-family HTH domain
MLPRERVTGPGRRPRLSLVSKSWPVDDFREYLKALMRNAGIADYAELSRLTGVSQNQFSNWRRGLAQPSRENLKKIAPTLGVAPVLLFIAAGLDQHEDFDLTPQPDFSALPKPFHDLREVYERLNDLGRGPEALRSISVLVAGLKAEVAELESIDKRRRRDQPSGRRRAS